MITTPFDINLYGYLLQEGYTHLHLKSLQPITQTGDQYYYVAPLKKDDPAIADLEWDGLAALLDSEETAALFEPMIHAKVMIEWTVAEYAVYLLMLTK